MNLHIARMGPVDLPRVAAIERTGPAPWKERQFEDELKQSGAFQYVVRDNTAQSIKGFLCGRRVGDEAEILKLAVARKNRRQGIGGFLLTDVLHMLAQQGVGSCFLELRSSNTVALRLYEKAGFEQIGTRKKYYSSPEEDAVLMKKVLRAP
jgi:ribosomal-protein-alanine N-acetyltransferase